MNLTVKTLKGGKFTIEIDDSLLGLGVKASVGINRDPKFKIQIYSKKSKNKIRQKKA